MTTTNELEKQESVADIINRIPNGIHLHRIREALDKGHAAVMVGSGFSLNAENGGRLPVWDGLIDSLLGDLYASDEAKRQAKDRLGGISGMLRLADEYSAVRGRSQLERRLHELLPDAGIVMPGDLHTKLLSLEWADVYTTNYDTLLERTLDTDRRAFKPKIKRRYQIVVAASDVPFSKSNGRPRVVKLHGSLRAGSRLIVSENDYREYPTDFAPFVNTVQQSMLENVFCLIGFSGDDPNFLLWTGWVRDRLGERTPPLYLITLKAMSEGQRLILERRSIFPIDISELGTSGGKKDHAASLNRLLDFWSAEPPQRAAKWPFQQPTSFLGATTGLAQIIDWIVGAQRNRNEYPGWLVAPIDNRSRLSDYSAIWRVFAAYRQQKTAMPLWLRTVFLDEVVWILDTMLMALAVPHAEEIEDLLQAFTAEKTHPQEFPLPESACNLKPRNNDLDVLRANLMLTMLRDAREDGDAQKFERWKARLDTSPASELPPDLRRAVLHEEVLFNLERRKRDEALPLLNALENVQGPEKDPYWRVRIGALFGEMGVVNRGSELVRAGLHRIREMIQANTETVYLVSREHWAERVLKAFLVAIGSETSYKRHTLFKQESPPPDSRPPEVSLQTLILREEERTKPEPEDFDDIHRDESARERVEHPVIQTDLILREIGIADEALKATNVEFDAQILPVCNATPRVRREGVDAASAFCRLSENAAFVPAVGQLGFSAQSWASCHRILSAAYGAERSLRVLFRANSGSSLASAETLGLASVATLSRELALALFTHSIGEIESIIRQKLHKWDKATTASLKFALDLASRVAFRLDFGESITLVRLAIRLHGLPALQEEFSLQRTFSSFLSRGLRLLSQEELDELCPELLSLTTPDKVLTRLYQWPNVVEILNQIEAHPKPGVRWRDVIDNAIKDATAASRVPERETFNMARLDWFYRHNLMSREQEHRFASLIWNRAVPGELPAIPGFYRGASLTWPCPPNKSPSNLFREWLQQEPVQRIERTFQHDGKTVTGISGPSESFLVNVFLTGNSDVRFSWTEADLLMVVDKLEEWWKMEGLRLMDKASSDRGEGSISDILTSRLRLIAHTAQQVIAPHLTRSDAVRRRIPDWLAEMWEGGQRLESPLVPLLFAGLTWWPERAMQVVESTISVLSSSTDRHVVNAALSAAGRWLLREQQKTEATRRYAEYLVACVRSDAERCLDLKLRSISELLDLGAQLHFDEFGQSLSTGLNSLLFELQDSRTASNSFAFASRPLLRSAIASLLAMMRGKLSGVSNEPTFRWAVDMARADSLRNVRNIV
jgi:hypothetical protein